MGFRPIVNSSTPTGSMSSEENANIQYGASWRLLPIANLVNVNVLLSDRTIALRQRAGPSREDNPRTARCELAGECRSKMQLLAWQRAWAARRGESLSGVFRWPIEHMYRVHIRNYR